MQCTAARWTGEPKSVTKQGMYYRHFKRSLYTIYKAGDNLVDHDGIELAGYLSFLSLLALFPFLVLMIACAGFIGQGELGARFIELIISHVPQQAVVAIKPRIDEIMSGPPQGFVTMSILGAIWTSSSMLEGMRTVLNRAYRVSNPPTYILRRLTSIVQLLLIMMVIMVVMSAIVTTSILIESVHPETNAVFSPSVVDVWSKYFLYVSAGLLFLTVAVQYYVLPNIKQSLIAVIPGAALVVLLWIAGAKVFTWYITSIDHQVHIIYGSLGSFIATLIFFFILNVIFIYGAELNHLIIEALGLRAVEKEHTDTSNDVVLTSQPPKP